MYALHYLISTIVGNSNTVNLSYIARDVGFVNQGGGFTHTYFYYLGGFLGTIIISTVLSRIINKIYNSKLEINNILRITITIYSLRWIIYYPFTLTRTAIFIPCLIYYLINTFNITLKRGEKNEKSITE